MEKTTAELHRKYFKEFVEDGQPHKLNEICAYIAQRMEEDGFFHRPVSPNRVQLSLRMLLRPTEGGYSKPCFGYYQKGFHGRLITPPQDKWSAILDKAAELRDEIESAFTTEIPLENPSEAEVHDYETIGKAMLESADLILDHYSVGLAMMTGAALATVIGTVLQFVILCSHFFQKKNTLKIVKPFRPLKAFRKIRR